MSHLDELDEFEAELELRLKREYTAVPRAEVWTSSDVTVEELRGEGDEPRLTAEALAEKIGESLSSEDDLS